MRPVYEHVCAKCRIHLVKKKSGITLKRHNSEDFVKADLYECPECGCQIYGSMGNLMEYRPGLPYDVELEKNAI